MSRLILASASPRRKELLKNAGYDFSIEVCHMEEKSDQTKPWEMVMELAENKAHTILEKHLDEEVMVLGADTVVASGEHILGKPRDEKHAIEMISSLQGKKHQVYTGVCICWNGGKLKHNLTFYEKTEVEVYPMSEKEITDYVATGECMDKAGSYAIQGLFARYVKGISGDYNNVVGLPVARIYQEMKKIGRETSYE